VAKNPEKIGEYSGIVIQTDSNAKTQELEGSAKVGMANTQAGAKVEEGL